MNIASISEGSNYNLDAGIIRIDTSGSEMNAHTLIGTEVVKTKISERALLRVRTNCISSEKDDSFNLTISIHYKDWRGRKVVEPEKKVIVQKMGIIVSEIGLTPHDGASRIALTININKNIRAVIDIEEITIVGVKEQALIDTNLIRKGFNKHAKKREICIGGIPKKARGTNLIGRFFGYGVNPPIETMSVLHLDSFETMDDYLAEVKRNQKVKGAIIPSKSKGYRTHEFHLHNFVPDYLDVNESAQIRQGKPMSDSYLRSAPRWENSELLHPRVWKEERTKGQGLFEFVDDENWGVHYGIFDPEPGHVQGDLVVDERLVGYLFVARFGEAVIYSYIIGHSEHNRNGIMHRLHFDFVEKIFNEESSKFSGIKCILYAGHYQGETEDGIRVGGLTDWKEAKLFKPTNLTARISGNECDEQILQKIVDNIGIVVKEGQTNHEALVSCGLIEA